MTITSLQQAKKDKNRINLFINDEFYCGLDLNTVSEFMLFKGKELGQQELEQLVRQDLQRYLLRKLKEYWFRKPRGPRDMQVKLDKLLENYRAASQIPNLLETARDQALAALDENDMGAEDFAKWHIEQRQRQAKYGKHKVVNDLIRKGINPRQANRLVDKYFQLDTEDAKTTLLLKKFGVEDIKDISDYQERSKAFRYLKSRGF